MKLFKNAQRRINEINKEIQSLEKEKQELQGIKDPEKTTELFNNFLSRYNGQELLKKYSLQTEGTWEVRGEDPNCDLGGHHQQPLLGHYKGKLQDVIEEAVNLKGFWAWGAGGSITKKSDDMIIDLTKN